MLYKVYSPSGAYKKTLSGDTVFSQLSFTSQANGGQWPCTVTTSLPYNDTTIWYGDVIKVYSDTVLLYSGFVSQIKRKFTLKYSNIEYVCVGIASLLAQTIYSSGWNYTFNKNIEPRLILEDIITQVNTNHNFFSYAGTIQSLWVTTSINFSWQTCKQAFDKVIEVTGRQWHIGADWVLHCWDDTYFSTHLLTLQQDIENIEINDDGNTLANSLVLKTSLSTTVQQSAGSVASYGVRQRYEDRSNIADINATNAFITAFMAENAQLKSKMTITCNRNYVNIDSIRPWDLLSVRNTDYNLRNLKISSVKWWIEKVTLEIKTLENYTQILQS